MVAPTADCCRYRACRLGSGGVRHNLPFTVDLFDHHEIVALFRAMRQDLVVNARVVPKFSRVFAVQTLDRVVVRPRSNRTLAFRENDSRLCTEPFLRIRHGFRCV